MDSTYAVILAGGRGTRFWPLSRESRPKQFLALSGGRTMLQATVDRITPLVPIERVLIVANEQHAPLVREQIPDLPEANLLAEPCGRNTAAACFWATHVVAERDPEAVAVVLSSDHHIANPDVFRSAVCAAVRTAMAEEAIVLYGLQPKGPDTNYGYIVPARRAPQGDAVPVARFHEKPPADVATDYIAQGCFWNSGMFTWQARTFLNELAATASDVFEAGCAAFTKRGDDLARAYEAIPSIAIDKALIERSERRWVVNSGIERVDLGNWNAVAPVWEADGLADENGNVSVGDVVSRGSRNTIHYSSGKLVATIGVEDLVVVEDGDVILVCSRDRAGEIGKLVERVRETGHGDHV